MGVSEDVEPLQGVEGLGCTINGRSLDIRVSERMIPSFDETQCAKPSAWPRGLHGAAAARLASRQFLPKPLNPKALNSFQFVNH